MKRIWLGALALFLLPLPSFAQYDGFTGVLGTMTLVVAASNSARTTGADYICTGTADQACINAAIQALPSAGGHVVLLDGLYSITGAIVMKNGAWLQGQGAGTVIKITTGTNSIDMIAARANGANSNLVISDLVLDANSSTGIQGIYFAQSPNASLASNNRVERCVVKNGTGISYGVLVLGSTDLQIQDSTFSDWGDSVMEIKSSTRVRVTRNALVRGTLQFYASTVAALGWVGDYTVATNTMLDVQIVNTNAGATIRNLVISGNTWSHSDSASYAKNVVMRTVNGLLISGNTFDSSADTTYVYPMMVLEATATNATIAGNIFVSGTGSAGAYGYGGISSKAPGARIEGNTFTLPGDYNFGVLMDAAATGATVRGNRIVGNSGAHSNCIDLASAANVGVEGNICDTWGGIGVKVAATSSGTRVLDTMFLGTVATPYSLLDTTALFRDQAGMAFAALPADVADGSLIYCNNCTIASPCAAGGTGALAKRLNNTYVCN